MKQLLVIVFSLFALGGHAFDNTQDKLYTKSNEVYTGYISTQIPGEQLIFVSEGQVIPFNYSDLLMIKFEARDPDLLTGLDDVIKTRSGKMYRGQIIEQEFGKTITIQTPEGERTIDNMDILEQQKVKMSSDYSLLEQAPYKTLVKTPTDEYTGIIIFQYYGNDETPSYLEISSEDGISKRVEITDIKQMRRIPNAEYREVKKFRAEEGKIYFNRVESEPVNIVKKKGKPVTYYIEDNSIANHTIVDGETGRLTVEMIDQPEVLNYKLMKVERKKIGKEMLYSFEEELAYKSYIDFYTSSVENKVMCRVYNVGKGMYILYKQGSEKVYFVEIK